ncbi:MAG: TIGR00730 family Rossman fold protein [bacterium]|nr:TIGR00730 family Rossman fold protein [bacterium]
MSAARKRICVFTGSSPGAKPEYRAAATSFGKELVSRGYGLVFGGGKVGLMGAVADSVLAVGGHAVGVIPRALMGKEIAHEGLDELEVVTSMHERKQRMAELSDAFVAMPGGMGTLEELSEVVTWAQLGIHAKPCGILNVNGYYDSLLSYLDHATDQRFLRREHRGIVQVAESPGAMFDLLESYRPVHVGKWMDRDQT